MVKYLCELDSDLVNDTNQRFNTDHVRYISLDKDLCKWLRMASSQDDELYVDLLFVDKFFCFSQADDISNAILVFEDQVFASLNMLLLHIEPMA